MKKTLTVLFAVLIILFTSGFGNIRMFLSETDVKENESNSYKWDLTDIFKSDEDFENALKDFEDTTIPHLKSFAGKLNTEEGVYSFLAASDTANIDISRIYAYAMLKSEEDQSDNKATAMLSGANRAYLNYLDATAFAQAELLSLADTFWEELLTKERMKPFAYQINLLRASAAHVLPENETLMLTPIFNSLTGTSTLYSKLTSADMVFPEITGPDGNMVTADNNITSWILINSQNRDFRKSIYEANRAAYGQYRNVFAQNMDNYIQANVSLAALQRYGSVLEAMLKSGAIPESIYTNLIEVASANLDTAHRLIALRAEMMGLDKIYESDTYVPLAGDLTVSFPYEIGKETLLEALSPLGDDYRDVLVKAFSEGWIDVYPADGKGGGAFSMGIYDVHPYILHNYTDDFDSLSTLAHELGHAVHQYNSALAAKSLHNGDVTIFTTEVASMLNELLLSDYMRKNAKTDEERLYYLFSELSLLQGSFFTQIMFSEFEDTMYKTVESGGSLTADFLESKWLEIRKKYNGEQVIVLKGSEYRWSAVPHFYYDYYVYQYATSIAAACIIADGIINGDREILEGYLAFLSMGNSAGGVELLKTAGVDMESANLADALIERFNLLIDEIKLIDLEEHVD